MAKPKSPKKTNGTKATIPQTSVAFPMSDTNVTPAEAIAAAPVPASGANGTKKTGTRKAAQKPEIVRDDPRANVVPGNLIPINVDDEIRRFAYLLSERRGFEPGHEAEDWLAAEREVRERYHQQSA